MAFYYKLGQVPRKRHTQFRKSDGTLYAEELISTEGFNSMYSLVYHSHPPTLVKDIGEPINVEPKVAQSKNMRNRSFITFKTPPTNDYLKSRVALLLNTDITISVAAPKQSMTDYFFKNADSDEVLFVN
jgi:homogentisate 1,2-dioxygenase